MKVARIALGMIMMAGLSACGAAMPGKAPFEHLPHAQAPGDMSFAAQGGAQGAGQVASAAGLTAAPAEMSRAAMSLSDAPVQPDAALTGMTLVDYEIRIPQSLRVSEANSYYPIADIVWRGDPYGDRKQQIGAIFGSVMDNARASGGTGRPVKAIITLSKFHALTERTRYSIGGWHEIRFTLTLMDPETGEVLVNERPVRADLEGFGGQRALHAEHQGLGQKVRISRHLDRVIRAELTQPGGWGRKDTDLRRAVDQI